jgi:hypothetical protein
MLNFLEIGDNFIHRLVQEIFLRRGVNSDNGILIMSARRITTNDDPSPSRPRPILQGQTIWNVGRRINGKVCHVHRGITHALWSDRGGGGRRAGRGNEFLGSGNGGRGGVFCSTRAIWGRNTVTPRPLGFRWSYRWGDPFTFRDGPFRLGNDFGLPSNDGPTSR